MKYIYFLLTALLITSNSHWGDYGISIEENRTRSKAAISISSPLVHELYKYRIADSKFSSDDKPVNFSKGDSVSLQPGESKLLTFKK